MGGGPHPSSLEFPRSACPHPPNTHGKEVSAPIEWDRIAFKSGRRRDLSGAAKETMRAYPETPRGPGKREDWRLGDPEVASEGSADGSEPAVDRVNDPSDRLLATPESGECQWPRKPKIQCGGEAHRPGEDVCDSPSHFLHCCWPWER